jgi:site-specific recombinase XerD
MSKKTGIHIFAHRFRHTLAQTLLDRGMRIEEVQQVLGHEKIDTTRRYCHANQRNTENSYRKFACM